MKVYVVLRHSSVWFSPRPTTAQVAKMLEEDLDLYVQVVEVEGISSGGRYKFKGVTADWWEPEKVYTTADAAREAVREQYREEIAKLEQKLASLNEKLAGDIAIVGDTHS